MREVEGKREEGDGGGRGEGDGGALGFGERRRRRLGVHAVRARQKPAGDLDAGTRSLAVIDESARALILDLVELVAVDGKRPAIGLRPVRGTRKRKKHGCKRRRSHESESNPQEHEPREVGAK